MIGRSRGNGRRGAAGNEGSHLSGPHAYLHRTGGTCVGSELVPLSSPPRHAHWDLMSLLKPSLTPNMRTGICGTSIRRRWRIVIPRCWLWRCVHSPSRACPRACEGALYISGLLPKGPIGAPAGRVKSRRQEGVAGLCPPPSVTMEMEGGAFNLFLSQV